MSDYQLWRYLEQVAELRHGWWYTIATLPALVVAIGAYFLMILAVHRQKNLIVAGLWMLFAGLPAVIIGPSIYISFNLGATAAQIGFAPKTEQDISRTQAVQLSAALDQVATMGMVGAALVVVVMVTAVILGGYAPQITRTISTAVETMTRSLTKAIGRSPAKHKINSRYGTLRVERSANPGIERAVMEGLLIGKRDADLVFTDPLVSRRHARIKILAERVFIVDLGSTNGTYVKRNGSVVDVNNDDGVELEPNDEIYLGPPDEVDSVMIRYIRDQ